MHTYDAGVGGLESLTHCDAVWRVRQLATPHSTIEILQGNGSATGIDVCQLFDTETRTEFQLLLSNLSPPRITIIIITRFLWSLPPPQLPPPPAMLMLLLLPPPPLQERKGRGVNIVRGPRHQSNASALYTAICWPPCSFICRHFPFLLLQLPRFCYLCIHSP
jgi:hypothetical protein